MSAHPVSSKDPGPAPLRTARLVGHRCQDRDGPAIDAVFADPEIRYWALPRAPGKAALWTTQSGAATAQRMAAHWAAHGWGPRVWHDAGGVVGLAGLQFAILNGEGAVEIAFAIRRDAQGQGYAREALAAILAEAPRITHRLRASVWRGNGAALHLLHGFGFHAAPIGPPAAQMPGLLVLERRLA
ncbi:MAG: GNAT family N-acetyltransferase [Pseudomonadota bacterium]